MSRTVKEDTKSTESLEPKTDVKPQKPQKPKGSFWQAVKRKKKLIILLAVVTVVVVFVVMKMRAPAPVDTSHNVAQVTRGTVANVIEGTGTIEAINQYEVTSLERGEIVADYFEEGSYVQKGDLLYKLDTTDLNSNIEKARASVEKSKLSNRQSQDALKDLVVTAPLSGTITTLYVSNGDSISAGTKIADIVDNSKMLLKVPFITEQARQLYIGQTAQVTLASSFTTLTGQVTSVGSGSTTSEDYVEVTTVEIMVDNPGAINPGEKATAVVGEYACNNAGQFENNQEKSVVSKGAGEVYQLNYKEGDYVQSGATLLRLDSASAVTNAQQSELSVKDAQLSLENYYDQMENYNITAPISGKVIQKNIKQGEKLDTTNTTTPMAIIADLSTLVFEISIDELDISSVSVGQAVEVTTDALPDRTFTGYIDNISIVGTSTNGVTSYPVKVVLNEGEEEGLIPGLNVNAKILVEQADDVLRVPVSAVRRGNTVIVKSDAADAPQGKGQPESTPAAGKTGEDVPPGFRSVTVETGLSDSEFIEIKSGLKEGDTVLLPDVTVSNPMMMMMGGGGGGGPQGEPPEDGGEGGPPEGGGEPR